ncbi:MAG: DnaJ domain-containing protein [Eubacteriales bacterium]|nr:DnaJ domain-containing protein [Eubacteriales bacterium]
MTDPYQILGIRRDASDDEIKKAYRTLSRKYHPDANINNPNKEQAEAKFKEVQQAYQQIMKEKEYGYGGSSSYGNSGSYGGSSYENGNPFGGFGGFWGDFGGTGSYRQTNAGATDNEEDLHLRAAANYINSQHYQEALNVLNNIKDRSARWYYYSAIANSGLGNNVIALEHAKTAYQMDPNNMQYQVLLQRLQSGGSWYQTRQNPYQSYSMGSGDYCMKLCIANLICNLCCGGGLCCGGPGYTGRYM